MKTVYIDGIFDLFHRGHLESLLKAKNMFNDPLNTYLLVGIVGDDDATNYKRKPIINEDDRKEIIKNIKCVNEVICPCPLIINEDFLKKNKIDMIVHGFVSTEDRNKQKHFYENIKNIGCFKEIEYYSKISTSDIIKNIKNNY